MRMTPKRDKGRERSKVAGRGRRTISFGSESCCSEVNDVSKQFEKARMFESDDVMSGSSVVSISSRGRQRVVPSYAENLNDSADEFESEPSPTWGSLAEQSDRKRMTPSKKTARKAAKIRNLFEESDDDSVRISSCDSAAEVSEEEAFSPLDQRNESARISSTASSMRLNTSRGSIFTSSSSESEQDEACQSPILTENSRGTSSIVNSVSNPFGGILAKVRQDVQRSPRDHEMPDVEKKIFNKPIAHQGVVRSGGTPLQERRRPIGISDTFFDKEGSDVETTVSPEEKETKQCSEWMLESQATVDITEKFSSKPPPEKALFEVSDSDESEFGAFKTVVKDVMLNTSRMASQGQSSDSEDSSNVFM